MSHSSLAIANEFLKRAQREGVTLTHMHLQKLLYIAHGWSLATRNQELVDEAFKAWDYGPVLPGLWQSLKRYGSDSVTRLIYRGEDTPSLSDDGDVAVAYLTVQELAIIDQVWHEFKGYEAFQLSALTHKDNSPWDRAFKRGQNSAIPNNDIQDYFSVLADAP